MSSEDDQRTTESLQKAYLYFKEIENELLCKNRFTNKKLDDLIEKFAENTYNIHIISQGSHIYRARIYDEEDKYDRYRKPLNEKFQGYSALDSYVNANYRQVKEGRCNPAYIPYLYAAESVECCIHEIRPNRDMYVSVATIETQEDLKLLMFQNSSFTDGGDTLLSGVQDSTVYLYFDIHFMKIFEHEGDYLLSQYISEKAKNMGFDGVAYQSAVYSPNKIDSAAAMNSKLCYAIFNYNKLKPISSELYRINSVDVNFSKHEEVVIP